MILFSGNGDGKICHLLIIIALSSCTCNNLCTKAVCSPRKPPKRSAEYACHLGYLIPEDGKTRTQSFVPLLGFDKCKENRPYFAGFSLSYFFNSVWWCVFPNLLMILYFVRIQENMSNIWGAVQFGGFKVLHDFYLIISKKLLTSALNSSNIPGL